MVPREQLVLKRPKQAKYSYFWFLKDFVQSKPAATHYIKPELVHSLKKKKSCINSISAYALNLSKHQAKFTNI